MSNGDTDGACRPNPDRLARLVLESALDLAVFTTDLDGVITSWNAAAERLLGWREAEVLHRENARIVFTPEDRQGGACQAEMETARKTGRATNERWHVRRDGSRFWGAASLARLEDDRTGEHVGYVRIIRDQTARQEAEERLRTGEALLHSVLESNADCLKLLTPDGRITYMNAPGLCTMEIGDFASIRGEAWVSFWPEAERGKVRAAMAEALAGGLGRFQGFCPTARGTPRWWDVQVTAVPGSDGRPWMLLASSRDITEREAAQEALRVSEARFRALVTASAETAWTTDAAGLIREDSPSWRAFTGQSREEWLDQRWADAVHPDDRERVVAAWAAAVASGRPFETEFRLRHASGAWRMTSTRAVPIRNEDGTVREWVGMNVDITERREAEEALRRSEERLRAAFAIRTVGVMFWGPDFRLTEVNDAFLHMTGLGREEAIGKTWQELTPPEFHEASLRAVEEITTRGETTPYEKQYYRKDGSRWWGLFAARRIGEEVVEFVLDVTGRKATEAALRESEERHRLAVRATNDAIWDWDLVRDHIEWNEALHDTYGHRPEEVDPSGEWWISHIHPEDRERVSRSIRAVIEGTGSHWSDDYRFLRADGSYAHVYDRGYMVRGPAGEPLRMIGAMLDVTERRRTERELRRLNEELEVEVSRRAEELRRQGEALRQSQKLEAVGQLTGGVAHDFNNLLTVIRSSADLLRRPDLPQERRRRYIEAIAETANRAAKLTGQLLAFARRQPLKPEVFVVGERVQQVVELIRPIVGARVAIEVRTECQGCAVEADQNQFETALVNLAVNARDAMDGEGRLGLRTWRAAEVPPIRGHGGARGNFVAVSVSDTGCGIPPELMGRIFEPFFTTKEVGKGTGLGLSQVYGFAKQSGGELQVESEVGRGTTFTLYLPLAEAKPTPLPEPAAPSDEAPAGDRRSVLLVEDNTQVGEFARQMLEDLGYVATWAPGAKAALRLLEEDASRFDLVFSDIVMPGMNGLDLGREIRRRFPGMPVILTSGYSHVLAAGGAQDFELVHKPYSVEALSRALRTAR